MSIVNLSSISIMPTQAMITLRRETSSDDNKVKEGRNAALAHVMLLLAETPQQQRDSTDAVGAGYNPKCQSRRSGIL